MSTVLQLSPAESRVLLISARLHDIGMVGVPRHVIRRWLENPDQLDPAETRLVQQHPILGQELAAFGSGLDQVGKIIRAHHEQFDGRGYPDQLPGENIPWLARLLAAAVAYASSPLSAPDALDLVKKGSGSAFDPEAVRVLLRALPLAPLPRKEREVSLSDLRPGMTLACGVYTHDGHLLISEGQQLSVTYLKQLANHDRVQPITQALVVYC